MSAPTVQSYNPNRRCIQLYPVGRIKGAKVTRNLDLFLRSQDLNGKERVSERMTELANIANVRKPRRELIHLLDEIIKDARTSCDRTWEAE
jgi:hypothetical protein